MHLYFDLCFQQLDTACRNEKDVNEKTNVEIGNDITDEGKIIDNEETNVKDGKVDMHINTNMDNIK